MPPGDALANITLLGLDTSPFIYFVEQNPLYVARARRVFRLITTGTMQGITSVVTLTEILTQPHKLGNARLIADYGSLFAAEENLELVPVDASIAERAAELRALYGLRTPDALQLATAIVSGCDAFLTNDLRFRRVTELRVLLLSDLSAT